MSMFQPNVRLVLPNKSDPTDPRNLEAIERWAQNFVVNKIVAGTNVTISQETPAIGKGATGQGVVTINSTAGSGSTSSVPPTTPPPMTTVSTFLTLGIGKWVVGGAATGNTVIWTFDSGSTWFRNITAQCNGIQMSGASTLIGVFGASTLQYSIGNIVSGSILWNTLTAPVGITGTVNTGPATQQQIFIPSGNTSSVYMIASDGLWKSTTGVTGTFTKILSQTTLYCINGDSTGTNLVAGGSNGTPTGQYWYSTNSGATWTQAVNAPSNLRIVAGVTFVGIPGSGVMLLYGSIRTQVLAIVNGFNGTITYVDPFNDGNSTMAVSALVSPTGGWIVTGSNSVATSTTHPCLTYSDNNGTTWTQVFPNYFQGGGQAIYDGTNLLVFSPIISSGTTSELRIFTGIT